MLLSWPCYLHCKGISNSPFFLSTSYLHLYKNARRSNQSILKEINPGISLEGMMLKLKLQYFGYLMGRVDSLEKTLMLGGIGGQEEKGTTEDEMAGWHHWLYGRESEWTPGVGDDREAWCAATHEVTKSRTRLSDWTELNWRLYQKQTSWDWKHSVFSNNPPNEILRYKSNKICIRSTWVKL